RTSAGSPTARTARETPSTSSSPTSRSPGSAGLRALSPCGSGRGADYRTRVSGGALATGLAVLAGLAGSVQVALMSRLSERIGVLEALAFSAGLTAALAALALALARRSLAGYERAAHQPWWMLMGGVMGLLIVLTITYAGPRIGVAATVGILIAG